MIRWLIDQRKAIDIERKIAIAKGTRSAGELTIVTIDHRVSCSLPGRSGWHVITKRTFLPASHFHSAALQKLNTAADHGRGRTIYCLDCGFDDEVVAALSYHIDDHRSWPLFITAIGFRIDFPANAVLRRRTLEAAFLLKQYVHAIAALTGRRQDVHADVPPNAVTRYAEELGFRKAPRLKRLRASSTLMRQQPLGDQSSASGR